MLTRLPGWSGYARLQAEERGDEGLTDLVAVGLAYEYALIRSLDGGPPGPTAPGAGSRARWRGEGSTPDGDGLEDRLAWQAAYKGAFRRRMLARLAARPGGELVGRPAAHAVFCIDVHPSRCARHLEQLGPYRTLGFAGFFGFPVAHLEFGASKPTARCPALLRPKYAVAERPVGGEADRAWAERRERLGSALPCHWTP